MNHKRGYFIRVFFLFPPSLTVIFQNISKMGGGLYLVPKTRTCKGGSLFGKRLLYLEGGGLDSFRMKAFPPRSSTQTTSGLVAVFPSVPFGSGAILHPLLSDRWEPRRDSPPSPPRRCFGWRKSCVFLLQPSVSIMISILFILISSFIQTEIQKNNANTINNTFCSKITLAECSPSHGYDFMPQKFPSLVYAVHAFILSYFLFYVGCHW